MHGDNLRQTDKVLCSCGPNDKREQDGNEGKGNETVVGGSSRIRSP